MKIIVKDENSNLNLRFPSGLILNSLTASVAGTMLKKKTRKYNIPFNISGKQLRQLIRAVNKYRKAHKDWVLVEVQEGSGNKVIIKP